MKLKIFNLIFAFIATTFISYGQSFNFANPIRVDSVVEYSYEDGEWIDKVKNLFLYKPDSNLIHQNIYYLLHKY